MILPSKRLLFWTGMILLPLTLLGALIPSFFLPSFIGIAAFIMLVVVDALFAIGRLEGIRLELPESIRMLKGREGRFTIVIRKEVSSNRAILIRLGLPEEIQSENEEVKIDLSRETSGSTVLIPCKAIRQGLFILSGYGLETQSPLCFWILRALKKAKTEFHVYPDPFGGQKELAPLILNRRHGIHLQRRIGKGRDFEQVREYLPGDDYGDIHWKSTAKWQKPVTKIYQIERTQEIYAVIDASRLSSRIVGRPDRPDPARGEEECTFLEKFVSAALLLGMVAQRQGDLFGVLTFGDTVKGFLRAQNGPAHFRSARKMLWLLEAGKVSPDFSELFSFIGTRIRRRALLLFLMNLDDPVAAEEFIQKIEPIRRRHLVMVNMIKPAGARPLFSSPDVETVDDVYAHLGGHWAWEDLRETGKLLKRRGVRFSLLDPGTIGRNVIQDYLAVKQSQSL